MYIATLITSPQARALDAALVGNLCRAWGGGDVTWLAIDEAAEFPLPAIPGNRWDVWADLQDACVDLVILPQNERRKRLLLADMDSTMIRQECIDELAAEAGVGDHVAAITQQAMNGALDFEDALIARVALLRHLPASVVAHVLETRISYTPGGYTLVNTMKAHGAYTALVSGGFTAFTARVAEALGFDEHRANTLDIVDDRLAGTVTRPILGRAAKVKALTDLVTQLDITADDVLAVGDGANDLGMLGAAGMGVALHAKPAVQAQCDIRINHGDLTTLLYLQGYPRDVFIT